MSPDPRAAGPTPEQPDELAAVLTGGGNQLQELITAAAAESVEALAGASTERPGELTPEELRQWVRRLRADAGRTRSCLRRLHEYYARRGNPTAEAVCEPAALLEWQLAVLGSLGREAAARGIRLPRWRPGRDAS